MTNETQEKYVKRYLLENGRIDRNMCLRQRITRLGAIIFTLKEKGFKFEAKWEKENGGRNFVYYLIDYPKPPQIKLEIRNGVEVAVPF